MANNVERITCSHRRGSGRGENTILLKDGNLLDLCEDCNNAMQNHFLQGLLMGALKEVFRERVVAELGQV